MKEALKIINECALFIVGKVERLNELDSLRKIFFIQNLSYIVILALTFFELIDDIFLINIDKIYYEIGDSVSICQTSKNQESEIIIKLE